MSYDLIIANGTVVSAVGTEKADVAIQGERIAAVGTNLGDARKTLDATGKYVLPGGVDVHVHLELPFCGTVSADDWRHSYSREQAAFPLPFVRANKFWPPVGRIDNPYGDRNLMCSCPPVEAFA